MNNIKSIIQCVPNALDVHHLSRSTEMREKHEYHRLAEPEDTVKEINYSGLTINEGPFNAN